MGPGSDSRRVFVVRVLLSVPICDCVLLGCVLSCVRRWSCFGPRARVFACETAICCAVCPPVVLCMLWERWGVSTQMRLVSLGLDKEFWKGSESASGGRRGRNRPRPVRPEGGCERIFTPLERLC